MNSKFKCTQCGKCCRMIGKFAEMKAYDRGDGVCKFLQNNLCSIYDKRPIICNVEKMYDLYFKDKMSKEEYIAENHKVCSLLGTELKNV